MLDTEHGTLWQGSGIDSLWGVNPDQLSGVVGTCPMSTWEDGFLSSIGVDLSGMALHMDRGFP